MTERCERSCGRPVKAHGLCQMHYDRERSRHRHREDRVLATRARNRANAALIKAHPDEFVELLAKSTEEVQAEHARIVALAEEAGVEVADAKRVFRLKRGPAAEDEEPEDRAQFAPPGCGFCSRAHERGHACPECGTTLGMPVERATSPKPVRDLADEIIRRRAAETEQVLAGYEGEFGDRYRVRVPPAAEYEWDDE